MFSKKFSDSKVSQMRSDIERMARPCPKGLNVMGVIDFNDFVLFCIERIQILLLRHKK